MIYLDCLVVFNEFEHIYFNFDLKKTSFTFILIRTKLLLYRSISLILNPKFHIIYISRVEFDENLILIYYIIID